MFYPRVFRFWNRIITAGMPGMAFPDPLQPQYKSLEKRMGAQGFNGILGAGGIESAGRRKQRRQERLVKTNQKDKNATYNL